MNISAAVLTTLMPEISRLLAVLASVAIPNVRKPGSSFELGGGTLRLRTSFILATILSECELQISVDGVNVFWANDSFDKKR